MSDLPSSTLLPEPTAATTPTPVSHSEKRIEIFATALPAFAAPASVGLVARVLVTLTQPITWG